MLEKRLQLVVIVAAALPMPARAAAEPPAPPRRGQDKTNAAAAAASAQPPAQADDAPGPDPYWPQWRGPLGTGVAPNADPPVQWSETKNVRWKIALPGKGHSTPVVWGDRIFVTTAVPFGEKLEPRFSGEPGAHDEFPVTRRHRFMVIALGRRSGKTLWEKAVREDLPHAGGHYTASLASSSPVVDAEHVFAFFGSFGLYCLDHDGALIWQADLGRMHTLHGHGEGTSPALHDDTLVINWDHEGTSFLVAFDKRTGRERWRTPRRAGSSWTTPIIVERGGRAQVIVSGAERVYGYDLANGEAVWECGGLSRENVVATPVAGRGIVYAGSSYDKRAVLAIRYGGARGDITDSDRVLWRRSRGAPYVPSFLLYDDALYFHTHYQGVLNRVSAATGEDEPGAIRLPGIRSVFASPVGAAGRVYVADREGATIVLSHEGGPPGQSREEAVSQKVLAVNHLDDSFSASPVIVGRDLYLRGEHHLYCLANP